MNNNIITLSHKIQQFFHRYYRLFSSHNIAEVANCYAFPCVLSTPEQFLLITKQDEFNTEFTRIFLQLQQASIVEFKATKASYMVMSDQLFLVCIDWQFIDQQQQVFSHFSAFYHLQYLADQLTIVQVNSQILENSLTLNHLLAIEKIND